MAVSKKTLDTAINYLWDIRGKLADKGWDAKIVRADTGSRSALEALTYDVYLTWTQSKGIQSALDTINAAASEAALLTWPNDAAKRAKVVVQILPAYGSLTVLQFCQRLATFVGFGKAMGAVVEAGPPMPPEPPLGPGAVGPDGKPVGPDGKPLPPAPKPPLLPAIANAIKILETGKVTVPKKTGAKTTGSIRREGDSFPLVKVLLGTVAGIGVALGISRMKRKKA